MAQLSASISCRHCSSGTLRRLPRNGLVKALLGWLPYRHYECKKCGRKVWRKPRQQ